jgi:DNA mismatch endonuclease (patch repair protein)
LIFIHGCFWHRHGQCSLARTPKSRVEFWTAKLEGNRDRDRRNIRALRRDGWQTLVIWECQLKNKANLTSRLRRFLEAPNANC